MAATHFSGPVYSANGFVNTAGLVMDWKGLWTASASYISGDVVRDGDWTSVAIVDTEERPAPQPVGAEEPAIAAGALFTTRSDISVVKMVHNYTMVKTGYSKGLQVRVPVYDAGSVSRITLVNNTTGEGSTVSNPVLATDAWTTLSVSNKLIQAGTSFSVEFEFYNSIAASTVTGGWRSVLGVAAVATQQVVIDNATNPTEITIHYTDLDGTDRTTELQGVLADSIIRIFETGDSTRSVEAKVVSRIDNVDNSVYTVTLLSNGLNAVRTQKICTVNIDVPITVPTQYSGITDYYLGTTNQPTFATVDSELYYDGVAQASVTDAYGINIIFQEATISDDWEVVSTSGDAAASSTTITGGSVLMQEALQVAFDLRVGGDLEVGSGDVILPGNTNEGVQFGDLTTADYGWHDMLGEIRVRNVAAQSPSWEQINATPFYGYNFAINDRVWQTFHIPHDYVPGTDIHLHTHWIPDGTNTASVKWEYTYSYSKGHNQDNYDLTGTVITAEESPPGSIYRSMVTETIAITIPNMEVDGMIKVMVRRVTNGGTDNTDGVFVDTSDIHYQSTGLPTINRGPSFYA